VILAGLRTVFSRGGYLLLAICVGAAIFVLATWLPNARLAWQIGSSGSISFADKARILTALIGSIATNFTIFSAISTMAIAGLFGANVAAITFYVQPRWRHSRTAGPTQAATSLAGLLSGVAGVGCAACGTFAIGPVLTFMGAAGLVALLPFGGEEFSVLGVAMLASSLAMTARKIGASASCPNGSNPPPQSG